MNIFTKRVQSLLFSSTAVLIFVLPLLVAQDSFMFPFIFPKAIFLRVMSVIIFAVAIIAFGKNMLKQRSPLFWAMGIYMLSLGGLVFFSVDISRSVWESHERMIGVFTVFHYIFLYFILRQVFDEKQWSKLIDIFLVSALGVTLISLIQRFIDPSFLLNDGNIRTTSTLGNTIYVAGFMLFSFFFSLFQLSSYWNSRKRFFYGMTLLFSFITIILTLSRGPFLGLVAGLGGAILLLAFLSKDRVIAKISQGVSFLGIIFVSGIFFFRESAWIQSIDILRRFTSYSFTSRTGLTRLLYWQSALEAFLDKPFTGWGWGNFYYAMNAFYKPAILLYGLGETWIDRAHNQFLHVLATQGIIGFFIYVFIFILLIWTLVSLYRREELTVYQFVSLLGFLLAYSVHLFFVFDDLTSLLYFSFFIALVDYRYLKGKYGELFFTRGASFSYPKCFIVAGIALFSIYQWNVLPAKANAATRVMLSVCYELPASCVDAYEQTKEYASPYRNDIQFTFLQRAVDIFQNREALESLSEEQRLELFQEAIYSGQAQLELHPKDIRVHHGLAALYQSAFDMFEEGAELVTAAQSLYQEGLKFSPQRQQLLFGLTRTYLLQGNWIKAEEIVKEVIEAEPRLADAHWYLANIYNDQNKYEEEVLYHSKEALILGYPFAQDEIELLFRLALKGEDMELAELVYEHYTKEFFVTLDKNYIKEYIILLEKNRRYSEGIEIGKKYLR